MSVTKIVRYTTRRDCAEENERLIRAVFAELATTSPEGIRYAAFRLDDGVTFVHLAVIDGETNPLQKSSAFADFQADIVSRCVEGPAAADATAIGNFRLLPE